MRVAIGVMLVALTLSWIACSEKSSEPTATATEDVDAATATPPAEASPTTPAEEPTAEEMAYDVVETWDIPNGGQGKAIVISPDYLNDADMTALGEKLKNDTEDDRNAVIFVFDNPQAGALRQAVLNGEASQADQDLYDQHYVGQYTKNANTGFHEFTIYFDGVMGTNQKTIQY
jgi:hypothetical protein